MSFRFTPFFLSSLPLFTCCLYASAQTGPIWNRRVEAVSVLPSAGGPHEINAHFSLSADGLTAPMGLDTDVLFLVNGVQVASVSVAATADPFGISCGDTVCSPIDGPCICITGTSLCACGWFLTNASAPAPLQPGDEIMVLLMPSPGHLPDPDTSDDILVSNFDGDPISWNRRVESLTISPSPTGGGMFDIQVDWSLTASDPASVLDLGTEVQFLINGVPVASQIAPATVDPFSFGCGDTSCEILDGPCICFETLGTCACGWFLTNATHTANLMPGDEIMVLLRPAPGALPELPGFDDDDQDMLSVPSPCPADITPAGTPGSPAGNGVVNIDDLVALLSAFGPCPAPPATCVADITPPSGNGVVNIDDLVALLSAFGSCPPV